MSKLAEMGAAIGKLCQEKNEAYGDSFAQSHRVLEVLYPNGIKPYQYPDALAIIRVIDKLFRIATKKNAFGESPWKDIAGYGILGAVKDGDLVAEEVISVKTKDVGSPWVIDDIDHGDTFGTFTKHTALGVEKEFNEAVKQATALDAFEALGPRKCSGCYFHLQDIDDYPCKKCWLVPYLPHWKKK